MTELKESLFGSIDEIVKARIAAIKFDNTVVCTIIDASNSANGEYIVSNDSTSFYAYSENTTYKEKDSVQVMIPQGDYDNQKIIIGKYTKASDTPYVYSSPFDNYLNVTGNLISGEHNYSLLANCNSPESKRYKRFVLDESAISGYTRLGLSAEFCSALKGCTSGEYGIQVNVITDNSYVPISNDSISATRKAYANINDNNEIPVLYIANNGNYSIANEAFNSNTQYYQIQNAFTFTLSSKDMNGDPYNFFTYYKQEAVFDISFLGKISLIEFIFYQNCDFKKKTELYPYQDGLGNLFEDNIFIKNPHISFGYDATQFDSDQAILFTYSADEYSKDNSNDVNTKFLQLRWIHRFSDDNISVSESLIDNAYIRWYRYKFPSPASDEYCGTSWIKIDNDNNFTYTLVPDITLEQEQIKAIVFINGKAVRSNIISFQNQNPTIAEPIQQYMNAFWLKPMDSLGGNYFLYNNSQECESKEALNEIRSLQCMFEDSALTDVEYIEWTFPAKNSMITLMTPTNSGFVKMYSLNSNNTTYTYTLPPNYSKLSDSIPSICRGNSSIEDLQDNISDTFNIYYKINETYKPEYTNNTVKCKIIKQRQVYEYAITFQFGHSGSNGSDYTLVISYDPLSGKHYNAIGYNDTANDSYYFKASLYDINHVEMDFNNATIFDGVEFEWNIRALVADSNTRDEYSIVNNNHIPPSRIRQQDMYYKYEVRNGQNIRIGVSANNYPTSAEGKTYTYSSTKIGLNPKDLNGNYVYDTIYYEKTGATTYVIASRYEENKVYAIKQTKIIDPTISKLSISSKGLESWQTKVSKLIGFNMNQIYILSLTLKNFGDYDLVAYLPLAIKNCDYSISDYDYSISDFEGPRLIRYDSTGYIDYYTDPCQLLGTFDDSYELEYSIFNPLNDSFAPSLNSKNVLQPIPVYMDYDSLVAIQVKRNNVVLWTQALFIYQNNYASGTINQWDGKGLKIDEETGSLIGHAIIAGKKNEDNTFSGVALGDLSVLDDTEKGLITNTGIYGFQHGAVSYAFKEDGTAFIGRECKGRIEFDGNDAIIKSGTWDLEDSSATKIDLDDGIIEIRGEKKNENRSSILLQPVSPYLKVDSEGSNTLFYIGNDKYYLQSDNYSNSSGTKIDLTSGNIDSYNFSLNSKNVIINSSESASSYFTIKDSNSSQNILMNVGNNNYYLQSSDYSSSNGTSGIRFDLGTGYLKAYSFKIEAGSGNNKIVIDSNSSTTYPLKIGAGGDSSPFRVDWAGKLYATGAEITGDSKFKGNIQMDGGYIAWGNVAIDENGTTLEGSVDAVENKADAAQYSANMAAYNSYVALNNLTKLVNGEYNGGTFISKNFIYSPNIIGNQIAVRPELSNLNPRFVLYRAGIGFKVIEGSYYYTKNSEEELNSAGRITSSTVYILGDSITIQRADEESLILYQFGLNNSFSPVYYVKAEDCEYSEEEELTNMYIAGSIGIGRGSNSTNTAEGIVMMADADCGEVDGSYDDNPYFIATTGGVRMSGDSLSQIVAMPEGVSLANKNYWYDSSHYVLNQLTMSKNYGSYSYGATSLLQTLEVTSLSNGNQKQTLGRLYIANENSSKSIRLDIFNRTLQPTYINSDVNKPTFSSMGDNTILAAVVITYSNTDNSIIITAGSNQIVLNSNNGISIYSNDGLTYTSNGITKDLGYAYFA